MLNTTSPVATTASPVARRSPRPRTRCRRRARAARRVALIAWPRRRRRPGSPRRTVWRTRPVSVRPANGRVARPAREPVGVDLPRVRQGRTRRGSRGAPGCDRAAVARRGRRSRPGRHESSAERVGEREHAGLDELGERERERGLEAEHARAAPPRTAAPWPRACAGAWSVAMASMVPSARPALDRLRRRRRCAAAGAP